MDTAEAVAKVRGQMECRLAEELVRRIELEAELSRAERAYTILQGRSREFELEVERLKAGKFTEEEFQGLCHGLSEDPSNAREFFRGCEDYQRKLFGRSAVAEERGRCLAAALCHPVTPAEYVPNVEYAQHFIRDSIASRISAGREVAGSYLMGLDHAVAAVEGERERLLAEADAAPPDREVLLRAQASVCVRLCNVIHALRGRELTDASPGTGVAPGSQERGPDQTCTTTQ